MASSNNSIGSDIVKILGAIVLVWVGFKFLIVASKFAFYAVLLLGAWLAYEAVNHFLGKED